MFLVKLASFFIVTKLRSRSMTFGYCILMESMRPVGIFATENKLKIDILKKQNKF